MTSDEVVLAEASGVRIVERDGRLHCADLRLGWAPTTVFVVGLVTFILASNAVIQVLFAVAGDGSPAAAAVLLTAAAVAAGLLVAIRRVIHGRRNQPLDSLRSVAVFDPGAGTLCDGEGRGLAPLTSVRLHRRFQFTSSAPALTAEWPGGCIVLVRGNLFAGGVTDLEEALKARGVGAG